MTQNKYKKYLLKLLRLSFVNLSWSIFVAREDILDWVFKKRSRKAWVDNYINFSSLEDAIVRVSLTSPQLVRSILNNTPTIDNSINTNSLIPVTWNASTTLGNCVYAICCLLKPQVVVETGVALGFTSFCILKSLQENQKGHLYSIDLPLSRKSKSDVGKFVPKELQSRWTLKFGPSQSILPRLLKDLGTVDIFIHDSRHTYRCQSLEYNLAWTKLNNGGVLISDDINNSSFIEFANAKQAMPIIIPQAKDSPIGIIVKRTAKV